MPPDHVATPVRLIVADPSENKAHQLDSFLRDAGLQTRLNHVTDLAAAQVLLTSSQADVLVCATDDPEITERLPELVAARPELAVLLLKTAETQTETNVGTWLELGARAVVADGDADHLLCAVRRELTG